jgi:hypothetical protein
VTRREEEEEEETETETEKEKEKEGEEEEDSPRAYVSGSIHLPEPDDSVPQSEPAPAVVE